MVPPAMTIPVVPVMTYTPAVSATVVPPPPLVIEG
jgi:hypothetical protein